MSAITPVIVLLVMVTLNALFVAAEFATVGARTATIQTAADKGSRSAVSLLAILKDSRKIDDYVATSQVGITLTSLVAGAYGQSQLTPLLRPIFGNAGPWVAVIIVLVFITALQVVLGELLPKTVALRYPEKLAMTLLPAMLVAKKLFQPLVWIFNGSAFALMRGFGFKSSHGHSRVHSPEELAGLYKASAAGGLINSSERDMINGALSVADRSVREIMTPRRKLVTISSDAPIEEALKQLAGSTHSRFPVVCDNEDVIGVVHIRDIFTSKSDDLTIQDVMTAVVEVSEFLVVPQLWRTLRESQQHCAIVINEYGSVTGLVTMEDAIEEIFGEVRDEFDAEDDPIIVKNNRVSVRGDVLLETLNDRFGLHLDHPDIDTVNGLIWHLKGSPPVIKDVICDPSGVDFVVNEMEDRSVTRSSFSIPEVIEDEEE
jgi:putative hemolysin